MKLFWVSENHMTFKCLKLPPGVFLAYVWKDLVGVREALQHRGEGFGPQRFGARHTCLSSNHASATTSLSFLVCQVWLAPLSHGALARIKWDNAWGACLASVSTCIRFLSDARGYSTFWGWFGFSEGPQKASFGKPTLANESKCITMCDGHFYVSVKLGCSHLLLKH